MDEGLSAVAAVAVMGVGAEGGGPKEGGPPKGKLALEDIVVCVFCL